MARAALNWSLAELAKASGVHRNTISNFETEKYGGDPERVAAIRAALEAAGVEFIPENGGGAGVRLRKGAPRAIRAKDLSVRPGTS
jgi:transcriptional regulator with XRE-family HTH domain